eukprot:43789-Eustigmatos_ZCMA.PRE.1
MLLLFKLFAADHAVMPSDTWGWTGPEGPNDRACTHGEDFAEGQRYALEHHRHDLHGRVREDEGEGRDVGVQSR